MLLPHVPHGNSPVQYLDVSSTWQLGILPLLSGPIFYLVGLSTFGDGMYGATVIIYLMIVWTLLMWSDVSMYLWSRYRYYVLYLVWSPGIWHALPYGALTFSTLLCISILFECWFVSARVHLWSRFHCYEHPPRWYGPVHRHFNFAYI
jgi:hypothetical protein